MAERTFQRRHIVLGYLRLAFGVAVLVFLLPPRLYALLGVLAFALTARAHDKVLQRLAATRRTIALYEHALARCEERWAGLHPRTTRHDIAASLYASDLDLFGPSSLFELLCEARTSVGENTLAGWLLTPSPADVLSARQGAVSELRDRLQLREAFAGAPGPVLAILDPEALGGWGESPGKQIPVFFRWIAPVLVALFFVAAWASAHLHSFAPLAIVLIVNACVVFPLQRSYKNLFPEIEQMRRALHTVAAAVPALLQEGFESPHLQALKANFGKYEGGAVSALGKLATLSQWVEARRNYFVRILDVPFLLSLQLALIAQAWRRQHGRHLRLWLQTVGEFEALLSLAAYSFEHPRDPFPRITNGSAMLHAVGVAHPLLSEDSSVRNDVSLGPSTHLLLISGSNMSGKSTLLRSVGVNAVLAFAGAPVRAYAMQLSPLNIAASIQVSDSLQGGRSRFYAEILRLRAITEAARAKPPVLFLLDELLAGTNSSDRLAGAGALVRELLSRGALGLLSTHDLALTALATESGHSVRNAHFEDSILDGELHFDYQLRDGVVERSNGLALMRLVGLDV